MRPGLVDTSAHAAPSAVLAATALPAVALAALFQAGLLFGVLLAVLVIDLTSAARPWQEAAIGQPRHSRNHEVGAPGLIPGQAGTVRQLANTPNRMRYLVEIDRPALLESPLFLPTQRRGLRAGPLTVTQTSTDLGPALAVEVPAGRTEVRLRYRPPGFAAGAALSVLAGLAVAIAWLGGLLRRRARDPA